MVVSAAGSFTPAHPKGYTSDTADIAGTLDRTTMEKLCRGEDGSDSYKNLGTNLAFGLSCSEKFGTLDEASAADVANTDYGISLIGASSLDRPVSGFSDGVWTNGNTTLNGKKVGAGGWKLNPYFYNEKGETQKDTTPNVAEGYLYSSLLTYNFGAVKQLNHLVFATNGANIFVTGLIGAADIYVSNDGINWTLHSYYDVPEMRLEGTYGENRAFDAFEEKHLGNDLLGTTNSNKYGLALSLEGVNTQYLRLAFTSGATKTTPTDPTNYAEYFNDIVSTQSSSCGIREIFVIGGEPAAEQNAPVCFAYTQSTTPTDNRYNIRLIAEIDSLSHQSAGFYVELNYFAGSNSTNTPTAKSAVREYASRVAYSSLLSYNGTENEVVTPSDGKYFIAINITDIPIDTHLLILTVTPTVTDENGAIRVGESYRVIYMDGVYKTTYSLPPVC